MAKRPQTALQAKKLKADGWRTATDPYVRKGLQYPSVWYEHQVNVYGEPLQPCGPKVILDSEDDGPVEFTHCVWDASYARDGVPEGELSGIGWRFEVCVEVLSSDPVYGTIPIIQDGQPKVGCLDAREWMAIEAQMYGGVNCSLRIQCDSTHLEISEFILEHAYTGWMQKAAEKELVQVCGGKFVPAWEEPDVAVIPGVGYLNDSALFEMKEQRGLDAYGRPTFQPPSPPPMMQEMLDHLEYLRTHDR